MGEVINSYSLPVAILPLRNSLSSSSSVPDCLSGTPLGRQNSVCNGGPQSMFFWMGNSGVCDDWYGFWSSVYPGTAGVLHLLARQGGEGRVWDMWDLIWFRMNAESMEGLEERSPGHRGFAIKTPPPAEILDWREGPCLSKLLYLMADVNTIP